MAYLTKEHFEQAAKNGIGYHTLYFRVYYYGWDIDKAITAPPSERFGNISKLPEEAVQIAKQNGLTRVDIWNRLNTGWTLEDAITKPKRRKGKRKYAG
jgi:hypothetical protein